MNGPAEKGNEKEKEKEEGWKEAVRCIFCGKTGKQRWPSNNFLFKVSLSRLKLDEGDDFVRFSKKGYACRDCASNAKAVMKDGGSGSNNDGRWWQR